MAFDHCETPVGAKVEVPMEQPQQAPPTNQSQTSSVEQSGICKGLDLSITDEQIECLDRKYAVADKELNNLINKQCLG